MRDCGKWKTYALSFPEILVVIANEPEEVEVRIKPVIIEYRIYLCKDSSGGDTVALWKGDDYCSEEELEKEGGSFIKWLEPKKTLEVEA
jgi:hypothetical protein